MEAPDELGDTKLGHEVPACDNPFVAAAAEAENSGDAMGPPPGGKAFAWLADVIITMLDGSFYSVNVVNVSFSCIDLIKQRYGTRDLTEYAVSTEETASPFSLVVVVLSCCCARWWETPTILIGERESQEP